ncbi:MAG: hypothetical protein E7313_01840 [Clostridiales bacterium]|nr:hypothetical protein [Clostridiales bacterium]
MYDNWEELENSIKKCELCKNNNTAVLGYGNRSADIMVIDYMYGTNVAEKKIIESVCKGIGLDIDNIYITNIIKCTEKETYKIEQCLNYLRNEVILVKPKIIILMGEIVIKSILGNNEIFSCGKGEFIQKKNINYMPTWHPVDFSNNIEKKIQFWNDYKKCYQNLTFYKN